MAPATRTRKSAADNHALLAVVGATDAAVQAVRSALANPDKLQAEVESRLVKAEARLVKAQADLQKAPAEVRKAVSGLDAAKVQAGLQQVPALAVARALEVAGKAEVQLEHLTKRGRAVVTQVRKQKSTQDLIEQGKLGIDRTRAAMSSARKVAEDGAVVVKEAFTRTRQEGTAAAPAARRTPAKTTTTASAHKRTAPARGAAKTVTRRTAAKTTAAKTTAAKTTAAKTTAAPTTHRRTAKPDQ